MRTITLRNIHPDLRHFIEIKSREEGLSLNKAVLRILEEVAGLGRSLAQPARYDDLDYLAGTWTAEEADAFDTALAEQRQIDRELSSPSAPRNSTPGR